MIFCTLYKLCKNNLYNLRRYYKMQKVVEFLQKNPVQYLATVGRDGKAKCRPFMFGFEQDGKLCSSGIAALYRAL